MKIKLKVCDCIDDWYKVVRSEHDGREWMEQVGKNSYQFMMSERLSSEACIEGCSCEIITIAKAILKGNDCSFKRIAVKFEQDGVHMYSPKNSRKDAIISTDDAVEFAKEVLTYFKEQP